MAYRCVHATIDDEGGGAAMDVPFEAFASLWNRVINGFPEDRPIVRVQELDADGQPTGRAVVFSPGVR